MFLVVVVARAYFKSCIDNTLLRTHNLIVPDDYEVVKPPVVPPPSGKTIEICYLFIIHHIHYIHILLILENCMVKDYSLYSYIIILEDYMVKDYAKQYQ